MGYLLSSFALLIVICMALKLELNELNNIPKLCEYYSV